MRHIHNQSPEHTLTLKMVDGARVVLPPAHGAVVSIGSDGRFYMTRWQAFRFRVGTWIVKLGMKVVG